MKNKNTVNTVNKVNNTNRHTRNVISESMDAVMAFNVAFDHMTKVLKDNGLILLGINEETTRTPHPSDDEN